MDKKTRRQPLSERDPAAYAAMMARVDVARALQGNTHIDRAFAGASTPDPAATAGRGDDHQDKIDLGIADDSDYQYAGHITHHPRSTK